jgi:hypothetical protein
MHEIILRNSNFFKKDKYTSKYLSLMNHAKNRSKDQINEYFEVHHILPKCIFPEYKNLNSHEWNAVILTGREHFIAHKLLSKIANKNTIAHHKLLTAFAAMLISKSKILNSRQYQECKNAYSKALSLKRKGKTYEEIYGEEKAGILRKKRSKKQAEVNAGKTHSAETIRKNSVSNINYRNNLSEKEKDSIANKISTANKGKKKPIGFSENISNFQKGRKKSEQEKSKLGAASKGTVFVNKDGINTKIKLHLLDEYIDRGWKKGMLIKKERSQK